MPAIRNGILMVLAHKTVARAARPRRQGTARRRDPCAKRCGRWASSVEEPKRRRGRRATRPTPTTKTQAQEEEEEAPASHEPGARTCTSRTSSSSDRRRRTMNQQILSQDEVDALLQGITGESQKLEQPKRRDGGVRDYDLASQERIVRGRMPTMEIINERFARNIRIGLFNFIRKSPEISIGGIKVQKYSAFLREIVVPTNFNIVSVRPLRGCGPDRLRPDPGVRGHRRAVRRRRQVPHAHRGPRLLAHRAAHHPAPGRGDHRPSTRRPGTASTRSSSNTSARRCSRSSPTSRRRARSSSSTSSRSRSATPAARSTSAFRTRRWSRSATCSTRPMQGDSRRARPALGQPAEAADPGGRGRAGRRARAGAGDGRAAAVLQAGRLHRARPEAGDPGQGRRRAGVRLPLRHLQRQVRAQDRSTADQLER